MGPGFTILLIDNEPNDVDLFRIAVENSGLDIHLQTVENGERALDYLQGFGRYKDRFSYPLPNVVVLDLHMPRKNGFEVLSWIRGSLEFRSLPVVVLSGSADADERERAYSLGASRFMVKPLGLFDLAESVREIGHVCHEAESQAHSTTVGTG